MGTGPSAKKAGRRSKKKAFKRARSTKCRAKDLDQIQEELLRREGGNTKAMPKKEDRKLDEDLPGFGQSYCETCDRHFVDSHTLKQHVKTKAHKKRVKLVKEEMYTQEEAERAAH